MYELKTFEDFGAVGDYNVQTGVGTDDTAAIQEAIDWAWEGDVTVRAILMTDKNFLCGNITTHPVLTIIGTGRHTSNFICKAGTTGKWWSDRGNGAQKLMLSGIAWYGRNEPGLTHVCEFGDTGIQFGSEGILQGLWMRDAPNAYGLLVNGNVGILRDLTLQSCKYGLKVLGNGNHAENVICMQSSLIGAEIYGCFVRGLHIEATASGGVPLRMNGDCRVRDILISTAGSTTFSHLVEVDTSNYDEWSVEGIQLLGSNYTISDGILKIGSSYRGGSSPATFTGASYVRSLEAHSGRLSIKNQLWQAFALQIYNDGGTIKHRIGSLTDSAAPASFDTGINSASPVRTITPTGTDSFTAFVAGGKISSTYPSIFIFDTLAEQVIADQSIQCVVQHNGSGVVLTAWSFFLSQNVNGTTKTRLVVQFFGAADGTPYALTSLPVGKAITVGFSGFLA